VDAVLFTGNYYYSNHFIDRLDFFATGIKYFLASDRFVNTVTILADHTSTPFRTK
jgi:hypothetical protein